MRSSCSVGITTAGVADRHRDEVTLDRRMRGGPRGILCTALDAHGQPSPSPSMASRGVGGHVSPAPYRIGSGRRSRSMPFSGSSAAIAMREPVRVPIISDSARTLSQAAKHLRFERLPPREGERLAGELGGAIYRVGDRRHVSASDVSSTRLGRLSMSVEDLMTVSRFVEVVRDSARELAPRPSIFWLCRRASLDLCERGGPVHGPRWTSRLARIQLVAFGEGHPRQPAPAGHPWSGSGSRTAGWGVSEAYRGEGRVAGRPVVGVDEFRVGSAFHLGCGPAEGRRPGRVDPLDGAARQVDDRQQVRRETRHVRSRAAFLLGQPGPRPR